MAQQGSNNILPTAYPASAADSQLVANNMKLKEIANRAVTGIVDDVKSKRLDNSALGQTVNQAVEQIPEAINQIKTTPEYRDKILSDFDNWKANEQKRYNDLTYTMTSGGIANGINAFNPGYYEEQLGKLREKTDQQDKRTGFIAGLQRAYEPEDGYKVGFTNQNKTAQAAKAAYDYYFNMGDADGTNEALSKEFDEKTAGYKNIVQNRDFIDEGQSAASRQSPYMSGKQYKRYIEWGMGGRPVEDIVDDAIYSKQDEMDSYGFIPYIVDDAALDNFHNRASFDAVNNVYNDLANLRRIATDYTVTIDGVEHSGKDVDRRLSIWWGNVRKLFTDGSAYIDEPVSEYDIPVTMGYYVKDNEGKDKFKSLKADTKIIPLNDSGAIFVGDSDGAIGYFDSIDEFNSILSLEFAKDGDFVYKYAHIPPAKLDDGTILRGDKAMDVYHNRDKYATYDALGFNRPYVEDPFKEGFAPWLFDIFAQSTPLFFNTTSIPQAVGRFASNSSGMNPGYDNYLTHTYSKISEDPSPEQAIVNSIASLVMPLTEKLWGPAGGRGVTQALNKIFRDEGKVATKENGKLALREYIRDPHLMPTGLRYLWESAGEGVEEIPGNIVEMLMSNAPEDFYADPIYIDSDGNVVPEGTLNSFPKTDASGNIVYDENTPALKRFQNYLNDIPLSFLGGLLMGGTVGAPRAIASSDPDAADWRKGLGSVLPGNYFNERIAALGDLSKRMSGEDSKAEKEYVRPSDVPVLTDDIYREAEDYGPYEY